jgi:ABC-type phosphate/phosphonate transport system substrate-binding protein
MAFPRAALPVCALTTLLSISAAVTAGRIDVLRIGASAAPTDKEARRVEQAALAPMQIFVRQETGLNNRITFQEGWSNLADRLAKGQLHLGVFEGYEFGWAREKYPGLRPLAVAVNVDRYPVACVVVRRDHRARDFAGLQRSSLSLPGAGPYYLRLFVERQCEARGKTSAAFFSRIAPRANAEDALDDIVDGVVQATVVDQAALNAYRRRKPGRFTKLKVVARSQPFPPAVVAYYGKGLDAAYRRQFLQGLLGASRKEKGRMILTLFRVTGFQTVPADFEEVLARTRKAYPPPPGKAK